MNFTDTSHSFNLQNDGVKNLIDLQEQETDNFSNACRICASVTDQVCSIFEELQDDLSEKINKYLPIKVSKEDGLPQVICKECQNKILAWDDLVKCSIRTKIFLQQLFLVKSPPDLDKIAKHEETNLTDDKETRWRCFRSIVKEVLKDYFHALNIEEENENFEYVCQLCDRQASKSIDDLTDHLNSVHSSEVQNKMAVELFIKDNITFEEVLVNDNEDDMDSINDTTEKILQNYCCPFCESVFSSPNRLVCHLNKHIEISIDDGVVCCDQLYKDNLEFVTHLQSEHVNRVVDNAHSCKTCGLKAFSFEELQKHINEKHSEFSLKSPKKEMHNEKCQKYIPVKCAKCNKTFSNKYNLQTHMNNHLEKSAAFPCDKCNKTYKSQGSLKYHCKVFHEGNLRFTCSFCGEAFPVRIARDVHARIHTGDKPYKCEQCGKSYRAKNTLDRHMDMHYDVRNYSCHLCPKKFRKKVHLNYHLHTHEKRP